MDENKTTPPPWEVNHWFAETYVVRYPERDSGDIVARVPGNKKKATANANLISAAPELLDALKEAVLEYGCRDCIQGDCSCFIREKWRCDYNPEKCFVQRWLAAIRKAEGLEQEDK